MGHETPPQWDRSMRQRLRRGEAAALGELYDRFAPLAHGVASRIVDDDALAAEVTREVFGRLWEAPETFEPTQGPMRSWVAAEAHRLGVELLRGRDGAETPEQLSRRVRSASTAARADYIVTSMPAPLRDALELTRAHREDYRQVARRLGITEAEARRRLRLGLQLLATAASYAAPAGPSGTATGSVPHDVTHDATQNVTHDAAHSDASAGSGAGSGDFGDRAGGGRAADSREAAAGAGAAAEHHGREHRG